MKSLETSLRAVRSVALATFSTAGVTALAALSAACRVTWAAFSAAGVTAFAVLSAASFVTRRTVSAAGLSARVVCSTAGRIAIPPLASALGPPTRRTTGRGGVTRRRPRPVRSPPARAPPA